MERLEQFLEAVRGATAGRFRGLLHVLVGMRITMADGTPVSGGLTWREAAALLKKVRWDREAVSELGLDPADLSPRDREKYWYAAIGRAGLGTPEARKEAETVARVAKKLGYCVEG